MSTLFRASTADPLQIPVASCTAKFLATSSTNNCSNTMPAMKLLRVVLYATGIGVISYSAYFAYSLGTADARVKDICAAITPGMSLVELQAYSSEHGLYPRPNATDGQLRVAEARTYGRFGCKVELRDGRVMSAIDEFLD